MQEYGYRLYDIERMDTEVSEFGTDTPIITVAENDSLDCIVYVRVGKVMYYECFIGI